MKALIKKAIEQEVPVDIKMVDCPYNGFLITEINEKYNTFSGYTFQEQSKPVDQRILTSDSINLILNIYSPNLEVE